MQKDKLGIGGGGGVGGRGGGGVGNDVLKIFFYFLYI